MSSQLYTEFYEGGRLLFMGAISFQYKVSCFPRFAKGTEFYSVEFTFNRGGIV